MRNIGTKVVSSSEAFYLLNSMMDAHISLLVTHDSGFITVSISFLSKVIEPQKTLSGTSP